MKRAAWARCTTFLLALNFFCFAAAGPAGAAAQSVPAVTKIKSDADSGISEYKLNSNGLQVLLAERHHTPIVTVMVVYHVGSRNEAVGYTGSTHFLEHMMFKGTAKHDPLKHTGIDDVLKPLGGINNATTYFDRTNYFETVPAQYMDVCLELEADRMRGALLRESDQKSEMTVVRNELERDEDDPARLMEVNEFAQAYMSHPYHHPVIGWRSDVENVPISRLHKFYNDFYYPNNATLVIIGDFQTAQALKSVERIFGHVPAAPAPFPRVYTVEPPQQGERRFTVTRGEDLPKVMIGFHVPEARAKDTYALEVASSILGDEKKQSSRLYKALMDTSLASDCSASNYILRDPGLFTMLATLTPDTSSSKVEAVLNEQAKLLAKYPVSDDELDKAKKSVWKRLKLEAADPSGLADLLAEGIAVADWKWWVDFEKNIKAVTKADVQRVAQQYFSKENETVGYYFPTHPPDGKVSEAPIEEGSTVSKLVDVPAQVAMVASAQPKVSTPTAARKASTTKISHEAHTTIASQVTKKVYPNGLTVLVMPVRGCGVVSISGKIKAGDYFDPSDGNNIPDLVAELLDKGSVHWTKDKLAQQLELMGTSLEFSSGNFFLDFQSDIVAEDVPTYLSMLSDVLQNPLFETTELEKSKKQMSAEINAAMSDTSQVAGNAFHRKVYKPDCVYYQDTFVDQIKKLQPVTVDNLKLFHSKQYTAANTVLAIVGDIDPAEAFTLVDKNFSNWHDSKPATIDVADCGRGAPEGVRIDTPLKDKTSVEVMMGLPAPIDIKSKDFYAASVANAALGHDTISSRLADLREKHGLTYGIASFFNENAFSNGPWMIDYTVNPSNLAKSLPIVDQILAKYRRDGINKKELSDESNRLAGEYIIERMRGPHQLADALTKYEILGLGAKFIDEYPHRVKAVSASQANAAIDKYFDPKKFVISVAGTIPAKSK